MTRRTGPSSTRHNRDSGLLDQSNADVIAKAMKPFTTGDDPGVVFENHFHWAVGHEDGFSIRVYLDGEITDAFTRITISRSSWPSTPFSTRATTPSEYMMRPSTTSPTPPGG